MMDTVRSGPDYQAFRDESLQDPYPFLHRLGAADPVHWYEPMNLWLVTRYDDVLAGLRDSRLSSNRMRMYNQPLDAELQARAKPLLDHLRHWLILLDAPDHGRIRRLIQKTFTPRMLQRLRPRIEKLAAEGLTNAMQDGKMDLLCDFAYQLPADVICEMLGIPAHQRDNYREWSEGVMSFSTRGGPKLREYAEAANAALLNLKAMFSDLVDQRRRHPEEDLLSQLIASEDAGQKLSHDELMALCVFLFIAGHDTTTNAITNGMVGFFEHPDQFKLLKSDVEGQAQGAVEEMLRYDNSVTRGVRQAKEDFTLRDKKISAGDTVVLSLLAANRDPEQYPDPDKFDIQREIKDNISFGWGPHFCIGAPLARIEIEIALREIVRQVPNIRPDYTRLQRRPTMGVRALTKLPVTF